MRVCPQDDPHARGRLSRLSVWWVTLGILPELIEPGQPQQNGHHVGLEQTGEHVWTVYFGPLPLGWPDESVGRILDRRERLSRCRKVSPINLE
jgi:hypothetical protein